MLYAEKELVGGISVDLVPTSAIPNVGVLVVLATIQAMKISKILFFVRAFVGSNSN
ncbi:MAG TPA: hypothetical protein VF884_10445 [Nitrososphaeraceae archaeon]